MSTFSPALRNRSGLLRKLNLNRQAASAGLMIATTYLFIGLPVHIGALTELGLTTQESTSWFFITWMTTGLFSIALAIFTRLPLSINLSLPVLIFIVGASGGFTLPEIIGTNLVAGIAAVLLAATRLSTVFTRLVPPQIALGAVAGSLIAFTLKTSHLAAHDLAISAPVIGGYVLGRFVSRNHLTGILSAVVAGFLAAVLTGSNPQFSNSFYVPEFSMVEIAFNPTAIIGLGIPILILTTGIGNIQAFSIMRSENYSVKPNLMAMLTGLTTIVNALGGGHASSLGSSSVVIASASSAGPKQSRYWAIVVSSIPVIAVALISVPVIAIVQALPLSYMLITGALALLPVLKSMIQKSLDGPMWLGALATMIVAAMPFQLFGLAMPIWALLVGIAITSVLGPCLRWQAWWPFRALRKCEF